MAVPAVPPEGNNGSGHSCGGSDPVPKPQPGRREQLLEELKSLRQQQQRAERQAADAQRRADQLRLWLKASGQADSLVPSSLRSGGAAPGSAGEQKHPELVALLSCLAVHADLSRQISFQCDSNGGGIVVAGRRVFLQRMAAWAVVSGPLAGLQISVPYELAPELMLMLKAAREHGAPPTSDHAVANFADRWELICAEMVSAVSGHQEAAIFLVSREDAAASPRAIIIAQWPAVDFSIASRPPCFEPRRHFGKLKAVPMPLPALGKEKEKDREKELVAESGRPKGDGDGGDDARLPAVPGTSSGLSADDRVLVDFRGRRFYGLVNWINVPANIASIRVDEVHTVVPLASLRPLSGPSGRALSSLSGLSLPLERRQRRRQRRPRSVE